MSGRPGWAVGRCGSTPAERQPLKSAGGSGALLLNALDERWLREPPTWNRPTGRADVDALVWFRYVGTRYSPVTTVQNLA